MSSDSPELEALFDSIAYTGESKQEAAPAAKGGADTPELETLFDSITQAMSDSEGGHQVEGEGSEKVFAKVGQMTRSLHNLLRELGYDKALEHFATEIPDNRDRLNYIAAMTAQAAEKTLNAAEAAQPIQAQLADQATHLAGQWEKMFAKQLGVNEFKALVTDTHAYLKNVPTQSDAINGKLLEIIMAQDFQDLTGQVIRKVLEAAQNLEKQLITLLLETTPEDKRNAVDPSLLEGPIINATGRSDVVTSQEQVDELLDSLGF
jgi:chemotaxis protein CheZ